MLSAPIRGRGASTRGATGDRVAARTSPRPPLTRRGAGGLPPPRAGAVDGDAAAITLATYETVRIDA